MVSLHYEITMSDYVQFCTHELWDAPGRKKKRVLNLLKHTASIIVIGGFLYYRGLHYFNKVGVFYILLLLVLTFLPGIRAKSSIIKRAVAFAGDSDNANIFTEHTLIATDTNLVTKTSLYDSKIVWKGISKKTETVGHFFLFTSTVQAIIIPKRAFGTKEELAVFKKILSRNLTLEAELKDDMIDG